ncbi:MAG: hypothetical protein ACK5LP_06295 [Campylobacteraceae bacterium]
MFVFLLINFKDSKDKIEIYLVFFYLFFFELNRGFYLFPLLLLFLMMYYKFMHKITAVFKSEDWIISIFVVICYFGFYLLNNFIAYMLDEPFFTMNLVHFFYIFIDSIISILLFKSR